MTQKLIPLQDSKYTNISAQAFWNQSQKNIYFRENELSGIAGSHTPRPLPTYNHIKDCKVRKHGASSITLGKDAPRGPGTGYSALGTPSSCISLKVGPMTGIPEVSLNDEIYVNDSPEYDAGMINISETTDMTENFNLPVGSNQPFKAKSGIILQADGCAIKGKAGVTITTSKFGERFSKGGKTVSGSGIELISGLNLKDIQPFVKGDNVEECLSTIIGRINDINKAIMDLSSASNQMLINLQAHRHPIAPDPLGLVAQPSMELQLSLPLAIADNTVTGIMNTTSNVLNSILDEITYLSSIGNSSISSDLNRTN